MADDRQRLEQRAGVERQGVGQLVEALGGDPDQRREAAVDVGADADPVESCGLQATRRPTQSRSTPMPTASTTPANSCPITTGVAVRYSPRSMWRSVPQIPTAPTRTTAWP
jgi:hypothetical protein